MSKIVCSNHIRETIDIEDFSIVRRMGTDLSGEHTIYIGKVNNGVELGQSEIKELLPYLKNFSKTGSLFKKKKRVIKKNRDLQINVDADDVENR